MKKAVILLLVTALAVVFSLSGCGRESSSVKSSPLESSSVESSSIESSSVETAPSSATYDGGNNSYTIFEEQTYQEAYGAGYDEGYDAYSQDPEDPSVPEAPDYEEYFGETPEESGESLQDVQDAFAAGWQAGYEDGWNEAAAEDEGSEYEY